MTRAHLMTATLMIAALAACRSAGEYAEDPSGEPVLTTSEPGQPDRAAVVARGRYLVETGGCHDCYTPMKMGESGPEPDRTRALSGHPAAMVMPPAPELPPGPWMAVVGATMTAWNGPWGTTFTANLTSDPDTGLGRWTEKNFIDTIRTGRRMGQGRPILPPMPIPVLAQYTDEDLAAIFAYLQTVPAVRNKVPEPIPPATAAAPAPTAPTTPTGGEQAALIRR